MSEEEKFAEEKFAEEKIATTTSTSALAKTTAEISSSSREPEVQAKVPTTGKQEELQSRKRERSQPKPSSLLAVPESSQHTAPKYNYLNFGFRNWMANHMARTPTTAAETAMSAALSVPAKANPSKVEAKFQPPAKPIPGEKAKAKPTSTPQTKSRHSDYRLRNSPRQ